MTRALIAAGVYVTDDLRDPDGMARPLLRRAALRLVGRPRLPVRRLVRSYLRLDPPSPGECGTAERIIDIGTPAPSGLPAPAEGTTASTDLSSAEVDGASDAGAAQAFD